MSALKRLTEDDVVNRAAEARSMHTLPDGLREMYRINAKRKARTSERTKLLIVAVAAVIICAALVAIIFA